ncbi:hypothetical protein VE03_10512 [Pseudogymnoascus sp. 23342-1-I1]|nr:hypothetical protein VE03_10512 [Pseudogymnoascus sp. 23342-1-I1]
MAIRNETPLLAAVHSGNTVIVEILLKRGASLGAAHFSLLLIASKNGHEATVKILLEYGANVEDVDQTGATALILARQSGHEAVKILIASDQDSDYGEDESDSDGDSSEDGSDSDIDYGEDESDLDSGETATEESETRTHTNCSLDYDVENDLDVVSNGEVNGLKDNESAYKMILGKNGAYGDKQELVLPRGYYSKRTELPGICYNIVDVDGKYNATYK